VYTPIQEIINMERLGLMIGSKRIEYEVEGDLVSMNEQFLNDTLQDLHLGQKTSQLCKGDAMGRL